MKKYRVLAEHAYMIEAEVEADTLEEAEELAIKLSIADFEPMTPTLDAMDNEDFTIVDIQLDV